MYDKTVSCGVYWWPNLCFSSTHNCSTMNSTFLQLLLLSSWSSFICFITAWNNQLPFLATFLEILSEVSHTSTWLEQADCAVGLRASIFPHSIWWYMYECSQFMHNVLTIANLQLTTKISVRAGLLSGYRHHSQLTGGDVRCCCRQRASQAILVDLCRQTTMSMLYMSQT